MSDRYLSSAAQLGSGSSARARIRGAALDILARRRRQLEVGARIVHYHHVFPDEVEGFRRQLEYLLDAFEPVTMRTAAQRLREGRTSGRELAITFDDGFRNTVTGAVPWLEEAGVQACFYLVTDLLDAPPAVIERICRVRLHLPGPVETMGWDDARRLLDHGHEIGSHTRSHRELTGLDPAALDTELTGSKRVLETRLGPVVHLSAPYGDVRRFSPAVAEAARRAGYETCVTAQRGLNHGASDLYSLRRHHLVASWPVAHVRYLLAR